jgi:hypothetical protein
MMTRIAAAAGDAWKLFSRLRLSEGGDSRDDL